jgi:hypothetical protein
MPALLLSLALALSLTLANAYNPEKVALASDAKLEPLAMPHTGDFSGMPCPLESGTFLELKIAANRLLYERRLKESKSCLQMALREYSHPTAAVSAAYRCADDWSRLMRILRSRSPWRHRVCGSCSPAQLIFQTRCVVISVSLSVVRSSRVCARGRSSTT